MVLDTNVVVSAALTAGGPCARIVDMLVEGAFEICADDRILDEYDAVLRRAEFKLEPQDVSEFVEFVRGIAVPVATLPLDATLPDPDDLPFLEVAAAGEAILVTGNERHFPKGARAGVTVVRPREFMELVRRAP